MDSLEVCADTSDTLTEKNVQMTSVWTRKCKMTVSINVVYVNNDCAGRACMN